MTQELKLEKRKVWHEGWYAKNKDSINRINREKRNKNKITKHDLCDVGLCLNCPRISYDVKNWHGLRNYCLRYNKLPKIKLSKAEILEKKREYRKINYNYRVANNLRRRLRIATKSQRTIKGNTTMIYLGCSKEELIIFLESKFRHGMSWDNYGEWHIDHIRPMSSFDLSKEEEIHKCMHFTNLQPLWAKDNKIKNNKYFGYPQENLKTATTF